jgi:hypothetical protein
MPFTFTVKNNAPSYGGQMGKLSLEAAHSGAYAIDSRLALTGVNSIFNIGTGSKGLALPGIQMPTVKFRTSDNNDLVLQSVHERFGPITACTASAAGALVTVGSGSVNLITGEMVTIRQVVGSTELNGTGRSVVRVSDTQFLIPSITSVTTFSTSADSIVEVRRPFATLSVNAITTAGVFTTSAAHGLNPGDEVYFGTIAGLTGGTVGVSYVKQVIATAPTTTTFTLSSKPTWTGGAFSGTTPLMIIRSLAQFGRVRVLQNKSLMITTFTIASPSVVTTRVTHGLRVGDPVFIDGALDTTAGPLLGGSRRVRTVPSSTTVTFEDLAGAPVNVASGTATGNTGFITGPVEVANSVTLDFGSVIEIDLYPMKSKLSKGNFSGPLNA